MKSHPYVNLPDYSYWKRSVSDLDLNQIDPIVEAPFKISRNDLVATAGSCFAQHIARHLASSGFNFMITEKCHPIVPKRVASEFGYNMYTARYGNIYTTRQLLQLFKRAYGDFVPEEDIWQTPDKKGFVDPFRPQIQPGGFCSELDYYLNRKEHFEAVREAFEKLNVFVFTLGLTESWINKSDGAVYPLCPGVAGGVFSEEKYAFVNFEVEEVTADLQEFIGLLRQVNPTCKLILTVSPVPLIATFEDRHVIVSTVYSKSVLRVACEKVAKSHESVAYFPSYEIVTGNQSRGQYFAPDLRSIKPEGVNRVMNLFLKHYTDASVPHETPTGASQDGEDQFIKDMTNMIQVMCDRKALDKGEKDS